MTNLMEMMALLKNFLEGSGLKSKSHFYHVFYTHLVKTNSTSQRQAIIKLMEKKTKIKDYFETEGIFLY